MRPLLAPLVAVVLLLGVVGASSSEGSFSHADEQRSLIGFMGKWRRYSILNRCQRDAECSPDGYCATSRKCKAHGSCASDADCSNQANEFAVDDCEGELKCFKDKTCGIECYEDSGPPGDSSSSSCSSDDDCGTEEYCMAGTCAAFGSCSLDSDCFNPSNVYVTKYCVGYVYCSREDQTCDVQCSGSFCPSGSNEVNCLIDPCQVNDCPESVNCVSYYCDGCNTFNFNEAGFEICNNSTPKEPEDEGQEDPSSGGGETSSSCSSDDDCAEEEFCMAGSCAAIGSCSIDKDCFNPSNNFPRIGCVGYLHCDQETGTCGVECTTDGTSCKPEVGEVNCLVDPCEVSDCPDAVSCTSNYCGGCNAFHFDPAGNSIC